MKQVLSIALLCFVMLAGSHLSLNLHYCGGKLASVEFFAKKKDTCNKCGMKKSKSCCQDVSKVFNSEDHSFTSFSFDFTQHHVALAPLYFHVQWEVHIALAQLDSSVWGHAPPHTIHKAPFYILFSSLIV